MMDRSTQFVLLVQAGAIVRDISCDRMLALPVVAAAMKIPEHFLPEGLTYAARQYLDYQYQTSGAGPKISVPDWLQDYWNVSKRK